jgi:hypothetical protein
MAEAVAFWSYVRQDDGGDHGRISALADDLREQYRIQTAEVLGLFLDRESIEWGEAWKERIDTAIAGTTFFIPIITPSYLRSPECRRELLKFAREAERLGLTQLLLSIYWVSVADLEGNPEESDDEVIRLVAKYNWLDLREERLEERNSSGYRKAVTTLAERLAERGELARKVADAPAGLTTPSTPNLEEDDGSPGVIDSFVTTEEGIPEASALLQEIGTRMMAINAMIQGFSTDVKHAAERGGMKAVLTLTNRLAQEMSEPVNAIEEAGRDYSQVLTKLDPAIHTQLSFIEAQGEPVSENEDYLREIASLNAAAREAQVGFESVLSGAESASSFSRSLKKPLQEMRIGVLAVLDGNAIIDEWGRRAEDLLGDEKGDSAGEDALGDS